MKVIYKGETRMVQATTDYGLLVERMGKIFNISSASRVIGSVIKLYYMDSDGDVIVVSS